MLPDPCFNPKQEFLSIVPSFMRGVYDAAIIRELNAVPSRPSLPEKHSMQDPNSRHALLENQGNCSVIAHEFSIIRPDLRAVANTGSSSSTSMIPDGTHHKDGVVLVSEHPDSLSIIQSSPPATRACSRHGLKGSWNMSNPCEECIQLAFEVSL